MINWRRRLYTNNIGLRQRRLRHRVEHGKYVKDLYLITIATNPHEQLDIIDNKYLMQDVVKDNLPQVVGMAMGHEAAVELVGRMAYECFLQTGNCHIRSFLEQQ